jgi:hypothetical protein
MKTKSFLIALSLLFSTSIFAQKRIEIGAKFGVNLAQLKTGNFYTTPFEDGKDWSFNGEVLKNNLNDSYDTRQGWVLGAYARIGKKLFFQPELTIATKGGYIDLSTVDVNQLVMNNNGMVTGSVSPVLNNQTVKVSYTNIDIPLLVGYRLGRIFRVNAGPVASLNVGANETLKDALNKYTKDNINDTYNSAVFNFQLGGGVQLGGIGIDVRHERSITEVTSIPIGNQNFQPKAQSWVVTLNYRIF